MRSAVLIGDRNEVSAQQNFPLAAVAGIAAAVAGAGIWAGVTISTQSKMGIVAILIGILVGKAICFTGKGVDAKFGYLGALCGLLGCLLGDVLSDIAYVAALNHLSFAEVLPHLTGTALMQMLSAYFKPMDMAFYAIAVFEGYKFSFKYRALR